MLSSYIDIEEVENKNTDNSSKEYKIKKIKNLSGLKDKNDKTLIKKRNRRHESISDYKKDLLEKKGNNDNDKLWNDSIYVGYEDGSIKSIKIDNGSITKRLLGY